MSLEGDRLARAGRWAEALTSYEGCLRGELAQGPRLRVCEARDNAIQALISQWHFIMLNDTTRNRAYERALAQAWPPAGGDRVVDIGTGSGLLAMLAARAGAQRVVAMEGNPCLARLAAQIIRHNGLERVIDVWPVMSHDVGDLGPERFDLLVTETFDAGLLGEGILPTLDHAWQQLLRPGARVIPEGAHLWGNIVQCPALWSARAWDEDPQAGPEPYDSQYLAHFEHTRLVPDFGITTFDFQSHDSIRTWLVPEGRRLVIRTRTTSAGRLDAVVVWFTLQMTESIQLDTAPHARDDCCWQQAVFPLPAPMTAPVGQAIVITFLVQEHLQLLSVHCPGDMDTSEITLPPSLALSPEPGSHLEVTRPSVSDSKSCLILDCSRTHLAAFSMLQTRADAKLQILVLGDPTRAPQALAQIGRLIRNRGIEPKRVKCLDFEGHLEALKPRYDIIILEYRLASGRADPQVLRRLAQIVDKVHPKSSIRRIYPPQFAVRIYLVSSDFLSHCTRVQSDDFGLQIRDHMNRYSTRGFQEIHPGSVRKCCQILAIQYICIPWEDLGQSVPYSQSVAVTSPWAGRVDALIYDVGPNSETNVDKINHYLASFVLVKPICVTVEDKLHLTLTIADGILDLHLRQI